MRRRKTSMCVATGFVLLLCGCVFDYGSFVGADPQPGGAGGNGGVGNSTSQGSGGIAQPTGGGPSGGTGGFGGEGGTGGAPALCEAPNLLACFEFEGNCIDVSGNGYDCITAVNAGYGPGMEMLALSHNLVTKIAIPGGAGLSPSQVTLEAWIYPRELPNQGERFGIIDNNGSWSLSVYPEGFGCEMVGAPPLLSTPPTIETWTHVGCVHDGSEVRLYIDGVEVDSTSSTGVTSSNTSEITIGSKNPEGDALVGSIDNLRIFSTPRTAAQMCAAASPHCASR